MRVDKSQDAVFSGFEIEVLDSVGNMPKISQFYNVMTGEKASPESVQSGSKPVVLFSDFDLTLAAGKSLDLVTDISRLVDLSAPGEYSVRLSRKDPADGVLVMSNVVKITIAKPETQ